MALATQAAVLNAVGQPLQLETLTLREPTAHEVQVALHASGVCHSDYHVAKGHWRRPLPVVLGHEGAGIVEIVGSEVTDVAPGDHVVLSWTPFCGRCGYCTAGRPVLCSLAEMTGGLMADQESRLWRGEQPVRSGAGLGTFAQRTVVPESSAVRIRNDVPFEIAAIVGCAVMTGVGAVVNTAAVRPGATVAVLGCGGVGLSTIIGASMMSAAQIIAVDVVPEKLVLATKLGATDVVDASRSDPIELISTMTGGRGVDYAFEAIGNPRTIETAFELLAPGGTAIVVGQVPEGQKIAIDPLIMSDREKTLAGSNYGSARPTRDIPMIIDQYARGRIDLDVLVAKTIDLVDINDALDQIADGGATRTVIAHAPGD